jgi:predicted 3-demethylubiquinone-9 3-methyltransferase (glyoxalase superfamily)
MKIPFDVTPFISFTGSAEEAVNFYAAVWVTDKYGVTWQLILEEN